MSTEPAPTWTAPYLPWRTLIGLIGRMDDEGGVPPRVDRSYLDRHSGGTQTQLLAALKSLDLIEPDGTVTPALTALVEDPDNRAEHVQEVLRAKYHEVVRLGEINGTQGQLEDEFSHYGVTGDTRRKAIAFYMSAAEYAGIPVSRYWKVPKHSPPFTNRRPRVTRVTKGVPSFAPAPQSAGTGRPLKVGRSNQAPESPPLVVDRALLAWLEKLDTWPEDERRAWLETFNAIFTGLYPEARPRGL
jgi:hypothetical protein